MRKVVRIPKHHKVINHIPTPKRKLIGLRSDLTQLIYWMEHDRKPGCATRQNSFIEKATR